MEAGRTHALVDPGIAAKGEVEPHEIAGSKADYDIQAIRARGDLGDCVTCWDLGECDPSQRLLRNFRDPCYAECTQTHLDLATLFSPAERPSQIPEAPPNQLPAIPPLVCHYLR